MKLFGLIESMTVTILETHIIPIHHPDLFKYLEANNTGASAGLELNSGRKTTKIPPMIFQHQKIHLDLYHWFKSRKQKTYFLEPTEQLKKQAGLVKQCIDLKKRVEKEPDKETQHGLWQEANKRWIEAEYERMVGKEAPILENIAKFKPDLVFLGAAHSASFYRQRERLQKEYGITIDEYWEDSITKSPSQDDIWMAMSACSEHVPMERYLEHEIEVEMKKIDDPKDALYDPETTHIERLYSAVKKGRVTDGNPDYIGTWDVNFEESGLFEVFVKERVQENGKIKISGTIEDCNGSADFEGVIDGNKLIFNKRYTNAAPNAAKGEINYNGLLHGPHKDGLYVGSYDAMGCSGDFWMKPFKETTQSKSP
jgi:hypothetical protein